MTLFFSLKESRGGDSRDILSKRARGNEVTGIIETGIEINDQQPRAWSYTLHFHTIRGREMMTGCLLNSSEIVQHLSFFFFIFVSFSI